MTARRRWVRRIVLCALVACSLPAFARGLAQSAAAARPIVIAHRGASGYFPEHTLRAYEAAVEQGADFIEPDLVSTRDGVLVVRHENEIGGTTDVATKFPDRRTTKTVDGVPVSGWFVEDFTLAELRTLRARERLSFRSKANDGQYAVPTFDEVLALAARLGRERGRAVGVYPETKHPTYFRSIGLPLEERLVEALRRHGLDAPDAPVFVQSFEVGNLRRLRGMTRVRLVQLVDAWGGPFDLRAAPQGGPADYRAMTTPAGLATIRSYADGVGANKRLVVPADTGGRLLAPTSLVRDAHAAGLLVHVWTLRSDSVFLAPEHRGDPEAEYLQLLELGVDGVFTDFPDVGVRAVERFAGAGRAPRGTSPRGAPPEKRR